MRRCSPTPPCSRARRSTNRWASWNSSDGVRDRRGRLRGRRHPRGGGGDGTTGLLVPYDPARAGDAAYVADFKRIVCRPDQRADPRPGARGAAAGRRRCIDEFSWEKTAQVDGGGVREGHRGPPLCRYATPAWAGWTARPDSTADRLPTVGRRCRAPSRRQPTTPCRASRRSAVSAALSSTTSRHRRRGRASRFPAPPGDLHRTVNRAASTLPSRPPFVAVACARPRSPTVGNRPRRRAADSGEHPARSPALFVLWSVPDRLGRGRRVHGERGGRAAARESCSARRRSSSSTRAHRAAARHHRELRLAQVVAGQVPRGSSAPPGRRPGPAGCRRGSSRPPPPQRDRHDREAGQEPLHRPFFLVAVRPGSAGSVGWVSGARSRATTSSTSSVTWIMSRSAALM